MALQRAVRNFIINDGKTKITEKDPLPGGSVIEVKKILSGKHPSITNATVIGPTQRKNGEVDYEFRTVAGEKG